ncbi:MAG: hypothetical protein AVDCRST_MAG66-3382 [uncultured Pseudonocardia sp.]|uniref:Uncharacterized protein n=1 Tax=uncultured Pseudonocardia sp. TaxID=211455 RepID=A0A6J4Q6U4_9PSEU|nr:MAG: hypothetical protein AVDCRST_MAG66-3382 [uncultured Pseudonocardia sp.]
MDDVHGPDGRSAVARSASRTASSLHCAEEARGDGAAAVEYVGLAPVVVDRRGAVADAEVPLSPADPACSRAR